MVQRPDAPSSGLRGTLRFYQYAAQGLTIEIRTHHSLDTDPFHLIRMAEYRSSEAVESQLLWLLPRHRRGG